MTATRRLWAFPAFLGLTGLMVAALSGGGPAEALPPSPTAPVLTVPRKIVLPPPVSRDAGSDAGALLFPPLSTVTYHVDPGPVILVQPGTQAGYGIAASAGAKFRIVWTGDAGSSQTYREFWGSVWTRGTFTSVTPGCAGACVLESNDYVSQPMAMSGGQRIDWDATTTTGLDGFDFTVSVEPVYFDLHIDGERFTNLVYFTSGGATSNAGTFPFGLTTH